MVTVVLGFGLLMNIGITVTFGWTELAKARSVDQPTGSDIYLRPEG